MKPLYIIAVLVGLQFNTMFASGNFSNSAMMSNETATDISSEVLAPSTPSVATFEDAIDANSITFSISILAPVVPMVADFSDGAPVSEISNTVLAPVTPKEADFEDEKGTSTSTIKELAPVTPVVADFEEHA